MELIKQSVVFGFGRTCVICIVHLPEEWALAEEINFQNRRLTDPTGAPAPLFNGRDGREMTIRLMDAPVCMRLEREPVFAQRIDANGVCHVVSTPYQTISIPVVLKKPEKPPAEALCVVYLLPLDETPTKGRSQAVAPS